MCRIAILVVFVCAIFYPAFVQCIRHLYNGTLDGTDSSPDKINGQQVLAENVQETTNHTGITDMTSAISTLTDASLSESECPHREIHPYMGADDKCPESFCQHVSYRCDAVCLEQDNTIHCEFHSCYGSYHCPGGDTVLLSELCDGTSQCQDGEDERRCTHPCLPHCRKCAGLTVRCSSGRSLPNNVPFIIDWNSLTRHVTTDYLPSLTYLSIEECWFCDYLMASYGNSSNPPGTVYSRLASLRYLDLNGNAISTLPENLFRGLTNLFTLHLSHNNISTIPDNVFRRLLNLHDLDLSHNDISTIPENVFQPLINLHDLDLSHNDISTIPENLFQPLINLHDLDLSDNNISTIPENVFQPLINLHDLDLSDNNISTIPENVFRGLTHLHGLHLYDNTISTIPESIFQGLTNLYNLTLYRNYISTLPENVFRGLTKLNYMVLLGNNILTIPPNLFRGLKHLHYLFLDFNSISTIPEEMFLGLANLYALSLAGNNISTIPENVFRGLTNLFMLELNDNTISAIPENVFRGLTNLSNLELSLNYISTIPENLFRGLTNLEELYLDGNKISTIPENVFQGLTNLKMLYLDGNTISTITKGLFRGLSSLKMLHMSANELSILPRNVFDELLNLDFLGLSDNKLTFLPDGTFANLGNLRTLSIMRNKIEVQEGMFRGIDNLTYLLTDSYLVCCVRPKSVKANRCIPEDDADLCYFGWKTCIAKNDAISSCLTLIRIYALRICIWIIGLSAFCGNLFVILYRIITDRDNITKSHSLFILNLSVSDLLMGVYLLIIGSVDVHYQGRYAWNAQKWMRSLLCTTSGILSMISSEMSTFVILLVTIDRFIVIVYPLSPRRITRRQAMSVSAILWLVSIAIAVIPQVSLQSYFKGEFYSQSGVCLALPLTSDQRPGTEYAFAIFVVLNSVIFIIILLGQICIFKSLKTSGHVASSQARRREITVARTLFFVVATDFCCWFPIGVMGVMSLCAVQIPDDVYAWVIVFVLPINSAVNPFLYTGSYVWRRRQKNISARRK